MKSQAVILVGLQGSGKTTYFRDHFAATHQHISRDVQLTPQREAELVAECLAARRSFVIDNTNATRAIRATLIGKAKAAGFSVLGIYFDLPVRTAIGRNNHRKDKKPIPVPAIIRTAKLLEPPSTAEGFDKINIIAPSVDKSAYTDG